MINLRTITMLDTRRTHPNLFLVLCSMSLLHLALGLDGVLLPHTTPIYHVANNIWPFWAWGICHFVVFMLMVGGLLQYRMVRWALLAALGLFLAEAVVLGIGAIALHTPVISPLSFLAMAAVAYATYLEPPVNPMTTRDPAPQ